MIANWWVKNTESWLFKFYYLLSTLGRNSQSFVQLLLLVTLSVSSNKAKEKQQKPLTLSRRKSSISCFNTCRRCIYSVWHHYNFWYSKIVVYQENYPWNCFNSFIPSQFRSGGLGIWQYIEAALSSDLWCSSWCHNWLAFVNSALSQVCGFCLLLSQTSFLFSVVC